MITSASLAAAASMNHAHNQLILPAVTALADDRLDGGSQSYEDERCHPHGYTLHLNVSLPSREISASSSFGRPGLTDITTQSPTPCACPSPITAILRLCARLGAARTLHANCDTTKKKKKVTA